MRCFLFLILGLLSLGVQGQIESKIIESKETLIINSDGMAEYTVYQKLYVADEHGKDRAGLAIFTNEFNKLKSARASLFDANGKRKKKYRKKDLVQIEASEQGILASGHTYQTLDLRKVLSFPYTMETEYTVTISSLFFWPAWKPQSSLPVEKATYDLQLAENIAFHSFSPSGIEAQTISPGHYVWSLENLEPYPDEKSMPPEIHDKYTVFFSADSFSMGAYSGSGRSWKDLGQFYQTLSQDQYILNATAAVDLRIVNAHSLRDTIAQIYNYLQTNTRYVGIELGIHGWKPHSSQWVCDNKYGDCKDLTTFFIALLDRYFINAYPVLIRTRSSGYVYPEFPDDRFNHVIACVPLRDDTLWVDCTVDDGRIDVIPAADQGCNVLLVDGPRSRLVQTPIQAPDKNVLAVEATLDLHAGGSARIQATLSYQGLAAINQRDHFQGKTLQKQREYILYLFDETAPGMRMDTFMVKNLNDKYAPLEIYLEGFVPHLATQTGSRLFLPLGIPYPTWWSGEHPSRRSMPYFAGTPRLTRKQISIYADPELQIENVPSSQTISTPFGKIEQTFTMKEDGLIYDSESILKKPLITSAQYEDYFNFRVQLKQADNASIVFKQR